MAAEDPEPDYMDSNAILYQHMLMGQRARGVTLGVGKRTVPSASEMFAGSPGLQEGQFGATAKASKPHFSQDQTPPDGG